MLVTLFDVCLVDTQVIDPDVPPGWVHADVVKAPPKVRTNPMFDIVQVHEVAGCARAPSVRHSHIAWRVVNRISSECKAKLLVVA